MEVATNISTTINANNHNSVNLPSSGYTTMASNSYNNNNNNNNNTYRNNINNSPGRFSLGNAALPPAPRTSTSSPLFSNRSSSSNSYNHPNNQHSDNHQQNRLTTQSGFGSYALASRGFNSTATTTTTTTSGLSSSTPASTQNQNNHRNNDIQVPSIPSPTNNYSNHHSDHTSTRSMSTSTTVKARVPPNSSQLGYFKACCDRLRVDQLKNIIKELRIHGRSGRKHCHRLTGRKDQFIQSILFSLRVSIQDGTTEITQHILDNFSNIDFDLGKLADEVKRFPHYPFQSQLESLNHPNISMGVPPNGNVISPIKTNEDHVYPPRPPQATNGTTQNGGSHSAQSFEAHKRQPSEPTLPITFKSSVFFKVVRAVSNVVTLPKAHQDRRTVQLSITLTNDTCAKLSRIDGDDLFQIRLFCCSEDYYIPSGAYPYGQANRQPRGDAPNDFPAMSEVRVNSKLITGGNLKGIKKRSGTAPPLNISTSQTNENLLTLRPNVRNVVEMTYVQTDRRMFMTAYLVQVYQVKELVNYLKPKIHSKEQVLDDQKNEMDEDLEAVSAQLSLRCPLSFARMKLPTRSKFCKHLQCFDGESFLSMMEQTPLWNCPVCNVMFNYLDLFVDGFTKDIVQSIPSSYYDVIVEGDLTWRTEDNKYGNATIVTQQPTNGSTISSAMSSLSPLSREASTASSGRESKRLKSSGDSPLSAPQVEETIISLGSSPTASEGGFIDLTLDDSDTDSDATEYD